MILAFNFMPTIQIHCIRLLQRNPISPIPAWMLREKRNVDVVGVAEKDQPIKHKKLLQQAQQ